MLLKYFLEQRLHANAFAFFLLYEFFRFVVVVIDAFFRFVLLQARIYSENVCIIVVMNQM